MTAQPDAPIRVLVVEDSASMRELLVRLLEATGQFRVVGTARDGEEAIALAARLRPDVISMDLHLPRVDGVTATQRIMAQTPTPIVVVSTTSKDAPDGLAFEALRAGALMVVDKPRGPGHPGDAHIARDMLTAMRLMSEVKVVRRSLASVAPSQPGARPMSHVPDRLTADTRPLAIVVAASTGGPQAIQALLRSLGGDLDVPLFVVQHMSAGFVGGLASWLATTCPQEVRLAEHGSVPAVGVVYIAPEDHHLLVTRRGTLALSKAPPVGGFRPSANLLFESAAECYGPSVVAVVLTGMGDDGAVGLAALRAAGATTIAQDEDSSVVYGMPRAAVVTGAATHVLPLVGMGTAIRELLRLKSDPPRADP